MYGRRITGDGTSACACGRVYNAADMVTSSYIPARSVSPTEMSSAAILATLQAKFAQALESVFESRPATLHSNQLLMARVLAAPEKVVDRKGWRDSPPGTSLAASYAPPHLRSKEVAAYPRSLPLSLPCAPFGISHACCTDNE